ncbi:MAG: Ig-like domain-containing protein [Treponema sp.]|jgi:hypothetical protein|nr:Ig-like domain-containing protein [Treponema sp.]
MINQSGKETRPCQGSAGKFAAALLSLFLLCSCNILRNEAFGVAGWSPGEGVHDPASAEVSLLFSLDPDEVSAEQAFSLSENARVVPGHFLWKGKRMVFSPAAPLEADRDYLIVLKTGAQDTKGLSLERQFEAAFSTRKEKLRPLLTGTFPGEGGVLAGERERVELLFSRSLDRSSLRHLTFSPAVQGVWSLEEEGRRAVFTPAENWITGREYRLTAGTALADFSGVETGREYVLHFSAGLDRRRPELLSACALDAAGTAVLTLIPGEGENSRWERNYRLALAFSEPVDVSSAAAALNCEPALGIVLETPPGYAETVVFRFSDPPPSGGSLVIILGKDVRDRAGNTLEERISWRIKADGTASKPPVLRGMRFPRVPGTADPEDLERYTSGEIFRTLFLAENHYVFDRQIPARMELYFETAPGASINVISLMNLFSVSATNGAVILSPREMGLAPFTFSPVPGWEDLCRVEIAVLVTNRPASGLVTFEVRPGLEDSLGNKSEEHFRILLLK